MIVNLAGATATLCNGLLNFGSTVSFVGCGGWQADHTGWMGNMEGQHNIYTHYLKVSRVLRIEGMVHGALAIGSSHLAVIAAGGKVWMYQVTHK